jgi:hypothetical protein
MGSAVRLEISTSMRSARAAQSTREVVAEELVQADRRGCPGAASVSSSNTAMMPAVPAGIVSRNSCSRPVTVLAASGRFADLDDRWPAGAA